MNIIDSISAEYGFIRGVALRLFGGSGLDLDDLAADCVLRALTKSSQFRIGSSLRGWMITIMKSIAYDALRRKKLDFVPVEEALDVAGLRPADEVAASREIAAIILAEIDKMRGVRLEVARRCIIMGCTVEETATALRVPRGTVSSNLARAKDAIRAALKGYEDA